MEKDSDTERGIDRVCDTACWALGQIGAPAIPSLLEATRSSDSLVHTLAIDCLGDASIDDPVLDALRDDLDAGANRSNIVALGLLGGRAVRAIPNMAKAIVSDHRSFTSFMLSQLMDEVAESGFEMLLCRPSESSVTHRFANSSQRRS